MTYPAPEKVPEDEWFNDHYMPELGDPPDLAPSSYEPSDEPPRPEEEIADNLTMHEKMYRIATARNNPFHVGGSENVQSEIDYIKKHSPWSGGSENFQGGSENVR